jgi:hypothetical protein
MKKLAVLIIVVLCGIGAQAQLLFGGNYKRFVPASDTSKYVYKTGGGVDVTGGIGLGKSSVLLTLTGSIDVLKINHKTNGEVKDGWLSIMAGLRKDFIFGHAKKAGVGDDVQKSFFVAGNYGLSASNYTARITGDAKKSLNTKLWNAGFGFHLAGFELAYYYHNMEDAPRKGWLPMHQFKIGLSALGK